MTGQVSESVDENLWLEGIRDPGALAWVAEQNDVTLQAMKSPAFVDLTERILEVIDSDDRIPLVSRHGGYYYNFWRDRRHPRGLWRRTTLESYRTASIEWEVLLDVDQLGRDESTEWVFSWAKLLPPLNELALIGLSPDGGDAVVVREFDLSTKAFVEGGFRLPAAKSRVSWIDADTIFVATDFGPGTLTASSYPRTVRRLRRGQPLEDATLVHEVRPEDLSVTAVHDPTPGFERSLVIEGLDFYRQRVFLLTDAGAVLLDVPEDCDLSLHREWLLVQPRSEWAVGDAVFPTGALLAIRLDDFLAGDTSFEMVFTPESRTALQSWNWTRTGLILTVLDDVASRLVALDPAAGWAKSALPGIPPLSTVRVIDTDADEPADAPDAGEYWLQVTGFTTPPTVLRGILGTGEPEPVKTSPAFFDAAGLRVEQHFALSDDGTRVPYFQVASADLVLDGSNKTLLSGYGGFLQARLPDYNGVIGRAWLARGGVYVLANIRGGGEYGPDWHTAALKANRHRAYEDFAAVARDLADRGVTTRGRLGCEGRSNGGLLVGNMLTRYPEFFGAVVCGVPLLDMQRYTRLSAGASWIAEYGDPEIPEEWEFIRTFSPYHLVRPDAEYPPVLFYTATSDDRVGPVQARKMAARMQAMDIPNVFFYENMEGGHGGAVDNRHSATLFALMYDFLWTHLDG